MQYLEDLRLGESVVCGTFAFNEEEIVEFARQHDPHPFHLDHAAAAQSIFERLTASGLQSACAARQMVLQTVMGRSRFLGSPGAMRMQLHSPVYPGREVRVTHSFESIEHLARWPGIGLVTSMTRGVDNAGELVITMSHLSWVASRGVQPDLDRLRMDTTASACLGAFKAKATGGLRLDADARIHFEDCVVGALYQFGEHMVEPADYDKFCRTFDAVSEDGTTLRNEWYGPSLGIRTLGDGFWLRAAAVGGTGLDLIRWPNPIHAGDRIHGEMRITEARPLRSRPHLGLVKSACICTNQRGEVVTSYEVTTFIRKRASDPG